MRIGSPARHTLRLVPKRALRWRLAVTCVVAGRQTDKVLHVASGTADKKQEVSPDEERIVDIDVTSEMEGSFLEYAYSVIYSRALPDARDGLKPVQRRILYQMDRMGLRPEKGHVKSARVVGEVMGRLHPHGDTAIYDTLVRLAQPFSLRVPLVDGHGNFGSLDDGPAASRYTEARLAPAALLLTADLDEDVVDLVPNYDNQLLQPSVLPAAFPNLLVNGASGIAVGMATNMAPHNLGEVIAAARHLIENPDASLEDVMRFVPGPDLPTGGRIVGLEGVRDAYRTGRGTFRTQATTSIENITKRRKGIVVTELPLGIGPERVIERIKAAVTSKRLTGIAAVNDLTDRAHGLRLVIELKSGFDPEAVRTALFRLTPMEDSFGINSVALVDGQPRTLGLLEMLQVYVDHRLSVVRRRSEFRLARRLERLHLVEGLLIAIVDIDEVIEVIRTSEDADAARTRLTQVFDLSEAQAEYILELRLRRLTKFSRLDLEREKTELTEQITKLRSILDDDSRLRAVVSDELAQVAAEHATPRRTILLEDSGETISARAAANMSLEIADSPCKVVLSATGLIARTSSQDPLERSEDRRSHDALRNVIDTTARSEIGVITSRGILKRLQVVDLPTLPPGHGTTSLAGGYPVADLVSLQSGERIVGLASLADDAAPLTLGTRNGVVKRVTNEYPNRDEWEVITLKDGDEVVGVSVATDDDQVVFITSDARLLRYEAGLVRPQGRMAAGMAGIRVADDAHVIYFGVVSSQDLPQAVTATIAGSSTALPGTEAGAAKVTPLELYPPKGRATQGMRVQRFLQGQDVLIAAWAGSQPAFAVDATGSAVALPKIDERRDGSGTALDSPVTAIG